MSMFLLYIGTLPAGAVQVSRRLSRNSVRSQDCEKLRIKISASVENSGAFYEETGIFRPIYRNRTTAWMQEQLSRRAAYSWTASQAAFIPGLAHTRTAAAGRSGPETLNVCPVSVYSVVAVSGLTAPACLFSASRLRVN